MFEQIHETPFLKTRCPTNNRNMVLYDFQKQTFYIYTVIFIYLCSALRNGFLIQNNVGSYRMEVLNTYLNNVEYEH